LIKGATVPVRVVANLPDPAVEALSELARKRNTNATYIIHYAISLARQLDEEISRGGKLYIQKSDGTFLRLDLWVWTGKSSNEREQVVTEAGNKVLDLTEEQSTETQLIILPQTHSEHLVAEVLNAAPLEAKKTAVSEAVQSVPLEARRSIAREAVESLSSREQRELALQFAPTQDVTDQIWLIVVRAFRWVLWAATVALILGVGVSLFRPVDIALVQILLTVFTTVAGIFAGFIGGKALSDASKQ
jgi:hypothetical protein